MTPAMAVLIVCGFLLLLALLDWVIGDEAHRDARQRNARYEVRDWTPWWTGRDGER